MFNVIQNKIKKIAMSNLLKKLNKQGLKKIDISNEKFIEFLELEIEILKNERKQIATSIYIGVSISILLIELL